MCVCGWVTLFHQTLLRKYRRSEFDIGYSESFCLWLQLRCGVYWYSLVNIDIHWISRLERYCQLFDGGEFMPTTLGCGSCHMEWCCSGCLIVHNFLVHIVVSHQYWNELLVISGANVVFFLPNTFLACSSFSGALLWGRFS